MFLCPGLGSPFISCQLKKWACVQLGKAVVCEPTGSVCDLVFAPAEFKALFMTFSSEAHVLKAYCCK